MRLKAYLFQYHDSCNVPSRQKHDKRTCDIGLPDIQIYVGYQTVPTPHHGDSLHVPEILFSAIGLLTFQATKQMHYKLINKNITLL